MNLEQQLQERASKLSLAAQAESTKFAGQLITVHVKNSNRAMEDISVDVPSHWRFGQLKRVLVAYHAQLAVQQCSHTQLQFMIAGKIIDDRNTLADQLNGVGQKQQNTQGVMPQLTIYLLKEPQPSVSAVEIDSQRKLLDQKIATESIWNQFEKGLQQMQGKTNKERNQQRETLRNGSKKDKGWQVEQLQCLPLFDPIIQANLEVKLKVQKENKDKKLSEAGRRDAHNNNNNANGNAQEEQFQDQANFTMKMFLKFAFFLGVIIRNFEGVFLYVLLGIFTGYAIVKYQEYKHNQQRRREQQMNRNNNNNNNGDAQQQNNNNNNPNPIPPVQIVNNNNNNPIINNANIGSAGTRDTQDVTLGSQGSNNAQADKFTSSENSTQNAQNNKSNPISFQGSSVSINTPPHPPTISNSNNSSSFPIGSRDSTDDLRQTSQQLTNPNRNITSQAPTLAAAPQQQQQQQHPIIPDVNALPSQQKKRKPTGIILFILRIKEFLVCFVMSMFPPWHIELYNKGKEYEKEEEQSIQEHPNQLADVNNIILENTQKSQELVNTTADTVQQNQMNKEQIQGENVGIIEGNEVDNNIITKKENENDLEQEILEESKENINEMKKEITTTTMNVDDLHMDGGAFEEYSEEHKKNQ